MSNTKQPDRHGNVIAREGVDRCGCGSKYWEQDRCVDCGERAEHVLPRIATERVEHEPCQAGTVGCAIDHRGSEPCETW